MNEIRARVIAQEKGLYRIHDGGTEMLAAVSGKFRYEAASPADFPAVGDYVIAALPEDGGNAVIHALFPRKSCFMRRAAGAGRQEQVVAANIDTVFICMSLNHNFNLRRLERYLATAYDSGAEPVIVLTKTDLCKDVAGAVREAESVAFGVDILAVSSLSDDIEAVKPYIRPGRTVAFLGSSGVGKSTLINKLTGEDKIATSEIGSDDKGRHTTTHRELITLANGAFVIDTPGMRELGMWDHEEGIERTFADIEALALQCRFSDCRHGSEPGCAIHRALGNGTLDAARWEAYQKLKAENEFAADGSSYLEAKRAKFKEIAKQNKAAKKIGKGKL